MTVTVARIYAGVMVAIGVVAFVVLAFLARPARDWLGFTFPGIPDTVGEAGSIFVANLRVMLAPFAGCLIAQWPWLEGGGRAGRGWRLARGGADTLIGVLVAVNVVVVGAAVGGYGIRMVRAMLPHGPVELLAFAAVLALYVHARRAPLDARAVAMFGGGAVAALAVAAVLETFGPSA